MAETLSLPFLHEPHPQGLHPSGPVQVSERTALKLPKERLITILADMNKQHSSARYLLLASIAYHWRVFNCSMLVHKPFFFQNSPNFKHQIKGHFIKLEDLASQHMYNSTIICI